MPSFRDTEEFSNHFPFGDQVLQVFKEHDLLDEGELSDLPLIFSLRESDVHDLFRPKLPLGQRIRVWREIIRWKNYLKENHRVQNVNASMKKNSISDSSDVDSLQSTDISDPDGNENYNSRPSRNKKNKKRSVITNTDSNFQNSSVQVGNGGSVLTAAGCLNCWQRSKHGMAVSLKPERWKTLMAFLYVLVVSWLTAFVMVIVHDRVPDMEKYPPLPDLLLDNLPHIPWAFEMCEMTGMILLIVWILVCAMHKHRFIVMRRFFSISGTIFLLRCVTMLLTSLSVPGKHLECAPRPYGDIWNKLYNAYVIWTGAGMTLQGVRTCGDYMFSGHTVSLTLLNFFITEYTPRRIYFLHTFTWICNAFGIFFILAAHEHYSIDVFIAFYISSRLFLYYHTLANNKGSGKIGKKAWFYFPLFYFFESKIEGKIPNEFEWPLTIKDMKAIFVQYFATNKESSTGSSKPNNTKKTE